MPNESVRLKRQRQTAAARESKRLRHAIALEPPPEATPDNLPADSDSPEIAAPDPSLLDLGYDLVLVSDPRVVVCKTHRAVVFNPVSHLARDHSVELPQDFFDRHELLSSLTPVPFRKLIALPFIDVHQGVMCGACGLASLHKHNLPCRCSSEHLVATEVQRFGGRGAAKYTFAVRRETQPLTIIGPAQIDVEQVLQAIFV